MLREAVYYIGRTTGLSHGTFVDQIFFTASPLEGRDMMPRKSEDFHIISQPHIHHVQSYRRTTIHISCLPALQRPSSGGSLRPRDLAGWIYISVYLLHVVLGETRDGLNPSVPSILMQPEGAIQYCNLNRSSWRRLQLLFIPAAILNPN